MINTIIISGRLTASPELKKTNSGTSVCTFTIANDIGYGDNKATSFLNCVAWKGTAELMCKYLNKGNLVGLEGRIQARNYTDKENNKRTAYEIVVKEVHFLETAKKEEGELTEIPNDDTLPF